MFFKKKRNTNISSEKAETGYPMQLPVKKSEKKNNKLYLTVEFNRPKWQQLLGAKKDCQRTFGLDDYGQEVLNACDGKTNISRIIKKFAKSHKLTLVEAEASVSSFMYTLMERGLIGIQVPSAGSSS
jgi:hypothetical protein